MSSFWKGKKVFLTGHSGFKGTWLTAYLIDAGAEVIGYSLPPVDKSMFTQLKLGEIIKSHWQDIRDFEQLKKSLLSSKAEIVIHMAAQALVKSGYEHPVENFSTNVMGTVNLFEACRFSTNLAVVINVTTDKVYRHSQEPRVFSEEDALGGNDPYSASKACSDLISECYSTSFFRNTGVNIASARSGNVIGGGDWAENRLIPDIVRATLNRSTLEIRNPNFVRPWQHVLDANEGYLRLAEYLYIKKESGDKNSFNFAPTGEEKTVLDIVKFVTEKYPQLALMYKIIPSDFHEEPYLRLNPSRSKTYLEWETILTFEKTVGFTFDWYTRVQSGKDAMSETMSQIKEFQKLKTKS